MSSRPPEPPYDDPYYPRDDGRDQRDRRGRMVEPPARSRLPLWAILLGLIALVLVAVFAFGLTRSGPGEDRLDENSSASRTGNAQASANPAERCGSAQTYDQVKRELFRQASATRGNDQAAFDRLAAYATLRMEQPTLKRQDESLGTLVCSARAALDLPPGVAVVGGRRTLSATLDYSLQNAADGSGQVVTLAGADPITVPLATLARTAGEGQAEATTDQPAADDQGDELSPAPVPAQPQQPAEPVQPAPPLPVQTTARPAFDCRYAKTRGEVAVCGDAGLAALDRQMTAIYVQALRDAPPDIYALLHRTRDRFLAYRDRCGSNACMAGAYRDRIREIGDITNGRWHP